MVPAIYQRAKRFVLQRARPIDYARWCFFFEGASSELVLNILSQYQNSDGGFGHALEADFWNPKSSPMQTWAATEIIQSLKDTDETHPIVLGILKYLESQADFNGVTWNRTVASNNDYPHAEWWTHEEGANPTETGYNPTASLAGFALLFAKTGSGLYQQAAQISATALTALLGAASVEVHELSCFQRLAGCVAEAKADLNVDMASVERKIAKLINDSITRETETWKTEYVCRPSRFIRSRADQCYLGNEAIISFECQFLKEAQLDDGSWPVTWRWSAYPKEWPIAQDWWRSAIVIENLLFLKNFDRETGT